MTAHRRRVHDMARTAPTPFVTAVACSMTSGSSATVRPSWSCLPWRGSVAFDVSSTGQVAGAYTDAGMLRGFRYTDGIGFEDIGSLAGGMTVAWAINGSGLVGGSSWVPERRRRPTNVASVTR